jgi:hypothetical protein
MSIAPKNMMSAMAWLTMTALADVIITVTLVCTLRLALGGVYQSSEKTTRRVKHIIMFTLESGALTSITAVAHAVVYRVLTETHWPVLIFYIETKLYSISLMASLNSRTSCDPSSPETQAFSYVTDRPAVRNDVLPTSIVLKSSPAEECTVRDLHPDLLTRCIRSARSSF